MPDSAHHPGRKYPRPEPGATGVSEIFTEILRFRVFAIAVVGFVLLVACRASAQSTAQRYVVVLNAAHGGDDAGGRLPDADGQTQLEKAYTLALSVRLRSLLAARGITVVTTRESDVAVDSDRRAEIANRANAQACLTLHASQSGTGIHIYASSLTPAEPSAMLPWKTAQAAWVTRSLALAGVINSALSHAGLNVGLGRTDLPTIDCMACPALAIEIGRESSQDSAQGGGFDNSDYQTRIAQALAAALVDWRSNGWRTGSTTPQVARP
jgi:N-acetylmuramoyl-L-alanine amidase